MKQLGFLVNNLSASQLSYYLLKGLNKWAEDPNNDPTIYVMQVERPIIVPKLSIMNLAEVAGMRGTAIATDIETAGVMLDCATTTSRFLYIWDTEWLRGPQRIYENHAKVIRNPRLKLLCRSIDHKIAVENCFNVKVAGIVDDFNLEQLLEIIQNGQE